MASDLRFVAADEVIRSEIAIGKLVAEDLVGSGEDRSGYGEDCLLRSTSALQAQELSAEVRVVFACGSPGRLDESGLEPGGARPRPSREALAGAFVEAWAEARPRHDVARSRKPAHSRADLGENDRCGAVTNSGDRHQAFELGTKGTEALLDASLKLINRGVQPVDLT